MNRWGFPIILMLTLVTPSLFIADGWAEDQERYTGSVIPSGYFTENLGQWADGFSFIGDTAGGHLALGPGSAYMNLQDIEYDDEGQVKAAEGHVVAYRFLGSSNTIPQGSDQLPHRSNYFIGRDQDRWASGARNFRKITYPSLWESIDLSYVLTSTGPKYEFLLSPGSDADDIRIRLEGINALETDDGELLIGVKEEMVIRDTGLVAYYADDLTMIDASFSLLGYDSYGFDLGEYDDSRPVIIDPYLKFTFIGGSGGDIVGPFRLDESGNIYMLGTTTSNSNFPITPGAYDNTYNGGFSGDIHVTKINSTFLSLDYCTYLGGTGTDRPASLSVRDGEVVLTGTTDSKDYPITPNAYNDTNVGWQTIIVTKLNRSGGSLEFSTLVDGKANESGHSVAFDDQGNVLVIGGTCSTDFPTTNGAYDTTANSTTGALADQDVVIFKLNSKGTGLLFSSFYGGINGDVATLSGVDSNGDIVISGYSFSSDLPITSGAYSSTLSGTVDMFLARLNHNASKLVSSSFFGGSTFDYGTNAVIAPDGDIIAAGYTWGSIPTLPGGYDTTPNGNVDSFLARFDRNFTTLKASTYIGGGQDERNPVMNIDPEGNPYIYGTTLSTDFPTTPGADDTTYNGTSILNLYLAKLDGNLSTLMYSTFVGGSNFESLGSLAPTSRYKVFLSGGTSSTDFKVEGIGFDQTKDAGADGYLLELSLLAPPTPPKNLNFTRDDEWVHLTWEAPFSDGGLPIKRYEVFRGPKVGAETLLAVVSPGDLEYNDTTVKVDDEFFYYVTAENDIGPSARSARVRIGDDLPPWLGLDLTPASVVSATELTFATEVFDNAFVDTVHIEYWWEGVSPTNVTMEKEGDRTFSFTIPLMDEIYSISYRFSLNDTSDNWFEGPVSEVAVSGNIAPQLGEDKTVKYIKAGERLRFSIEAWDNVELEEVTIEFWSDDIYMQNLSMQNTEGNVFEYELKTKRYSLAPVEYLFHAVDISGHWNASPQKAVQLLDAELPQIAYDTTPQEATTGDMFTFSVSISDNREVSAAWVEFSINDMQFNRTLENSFGNIYSLEIEMPDEIGRMSYMFIALDTNDNMAWVPIKQVLVLDNDRPVIVEDQTNDTAYCGEEHHFSVKASDNVGIGDVLLEYWFGESEHRNLRMEKDEMYTANLEVPSSSAKDLYYIVRAVDTSGNSVETEPVKITVKDRIGPYLVKDLTPAVAFTGGDVIFDVKASDNIGIKRISCIWKIGVYPEEELFLDRSDGTFTGSIEVPMDDLDGITYHLIIVDPSGNQVPTGERIITVVDGIAPVIEQVQDLDIGPNTELNIEISTNDNIGVTSLTIENSPLELQGNWIKGRIDEPGKYHVTVTAMDEAGNAAEMTFVITIVADFGGGEEDKTGDPVWIYVPPVLGLLVLAASVVIFFVVRPKKRENGQPLILSGPVIEAPRDPLAEQRESDELEKLFKESYGNGK